MQKIFYDFSVLLTGFTLLNKELNDAYFGQLTTAFPVDFPAALTTYTKLKVDKGHNIGLLVKNEMTQNANFKTTVNNIITIWYLGKLNNVTKSTFDPICYYEALAWKVGQAHPVGLTGGYFGYWHYPPEN